MFESRRIKSTLSQWYTVFVVWNSVRKANMLFQLEISQKWSIPCYYEYILSKSAVCLAFLCMFFTSISVIGELLESFSFAIFLSSFPWNQDLFAKPQSTCIKLSTVVSIFFFTNCITTFFAWIINCAQTDFSS